MYSCFGDFLSAHCLDSVYVFFPMQFTGYIPYSTNKIFNIYFFIFYLSPDHAEWFATGLYVYVGQIVF